MSQSIPLLAAAALIGVFHMSAPDHWATLCILGQRWSWSRRRLVGLGLATAGGHVLISILLGLLVVLLGLAFSSAVSTAATTAIGLAMVVLGTGYGAKTLLSKGKDDYEREAEEEIARSNSSGQRLTYFVALGGALSPDLSILPVFLLAVPDGLGLVAGTAAVFAISSVLALVSLILIGSMGIARALARLPAKYNDALVGFVIAAVGAYVLFFG